MKITHLLSLLGPLAGFAQRHLGVLRPGLSVPGPRLDASSSCAVPGQESRVFTVMDVRDLLMSPVVDPLIERLRRSGIDAEIALPAHPLPVLADGSQILQILEHLSTLVCDLLPAGCTLRLLARADSGHVVLNLADAALGSDEPRIGRLFHTACGAARRSRGEDFVKSIEHCQRIVGAHGGRIYAAPSPLAGLGITLRIPGYPDK